MDVCVSTPTSLKTGYNVSIPVDELAEASILLVYQSCENIRITIRRVGQSWYSASVTELRNLHIASSQHEDVA